MNSPLFLYRYRTRAHRRWVSENSTELMGMEIELEIFSVIRTTPKGVWVNIKYNKDKWVSLTSRIAFAYDTKEKALASFKIRNSYHIDYLKRDLRAAILSRRAADNDDLWEPVKPEWTKLSRFSENFV